MDDLVGGVIEAAAEGIAEVAGEVLIDERTSRRGDGGCALLALVVFIAAIGSLALLYYFW
ncbi:MAG: hypothetical protein Q7S96_04540 [bacterium]|nr:hypothetical protein [bacterium]